MNIIRTAKVAPHAKLGKVSFDTGSLAYFIGYHTCECCGAVGKILVSSDNVRELRRVFGSERTPLGERITRKLTRHYGL